MISYLSMLFASLGAMLLMLFAPLSNFLFPPDPTCSLTVSTLVQQATTFEEGSTTIASGETVTVAWKSTGAREAHTSEGAAIALQGASEYTPTATTTYSYTFVGRNASVLCGVSVFVHPKVESTPTPVPTVPVVVIPPVKPPVKKPVPPVVVPPPPLPVIVPPEPTTTDVTIGTTTLVVGNIPLLSGGTAHAGQTVPVSYLQVTNTGKEYALVKGFWLTQSGSAPTSVVEGLSVVDDKGGSRGSSGNPDFVQTSALFAPGQRRLFTIKAILSGNVSSSIGTTLILQVSSLDSTATVKGKFPIQGTTWTIAP